MKNKLKSLIGYLSTFMPALFVALIGVFLGVGPVYAASLYVAPTGSDAGANTCLVAGSPCLTIGYSVTQATSGDTVNVSAGTYPEMVSVGKSLTFLGANAGISAGTVPGVRAGESVVKGFRNPGNPGTTQYDINIDGFTIDPQGDTTLITATSQPLIWLFGGNDSITNNVFIGSNSYASNCSFTCTTMTDYALELRSGAILIQDNSFTNFRRPVNIGMTSAVTPIISTTINRNVLTNVTSRGFQLGQSTGLHSMPGVNLTNNSIDATGFTSPSSPGGVVVTQDSNVISNNTFTGLGSGVYVSLCRKWSTQNQTISDNNFNSNGAGVLFDDFSLTAFNGLTSQCYNLFPSFGGDVNGTVISNNNFVGNTAAGITGFSYVNGSNPSAFTSTSGGVSISNATNASPIVVTTSGGHGLSTGQQIVLSGIGGNTAANGTWVITKISGTQFSLNGSTGNGTFTSGGVFYVIPLPVVPASGTLNANCNWWNSVTGAGDAGEGSGDQIFPGFTFTQGVTFYPRPPEFSWLLGAAPAGACTGGTLAPTSSFLATPTSGLAPLNVGFDASASTDADGTIVSYDWDFGDSTTDTGVTTSHIYASSGMYIVTLTTTDNDGHTAVSTQNINVTALIPPVAAFLAVPVSGVVPLNVAVDASTSTDADGTIVSYDWNFGDSTTGTGVTTSHIYTMAGVYTLTLKVTDNDSLASTITQTITVNPLPSPTTGGSSGGSAQFGKPSCSGAACSATAVSAPMQPPINQEVNSCGRDNDAFPFVDSENHWGRVWIEDLYRLCVIDGKSGDKFGPDDFANRAEVAKIAVRLFKLKESAFTNLFLDVENQDWFSSYVMSAAKSGITVGYIDATGNSLFKGDQSITRAEALKILLKAKGIQIDEMNLINPEYSDVKPADWYYDLVVYATQNKIIEGYSSIAVPKFFAPNKPVTRAEVSKIALLIAGLEK